LLCQVRDAGYVYEAVMGKEFSITLEVVLQDQPITGLEEVLAPR